MITKIEDVGIIQMHLNGGFTKILLEKTIGVGMADGGICIDVPTEIIPLHLRNIHTRVYLRIEDMNTEVEQIKE